LAYLPASTKLVVVVQGGASVWLGLGLLAVVSACGGLSGSTDDTGGSAARAGTTTGGASTTGGTWVVDQRWQRPPGATAGGPRNGRRVPALRRTR
jgi:hypothetical protein